MKTTTSSQAKTGRKPVSQTTRRAQPASNGAVRKSSRTAPRKRSAERHDDLHEAEVVEQPDVAAILAMDAMPPPPPEMTQASESPMQRFLHSREYQSMQFQKFASHAAHATGTGWAFWAAAGTVVLWMLLGPVFGFSNTWQLVINTATTIVTFLMVFLIQNTQNRDTKAMNLKLDELLRVIGKADNTMIDIEDLSDEDLERIAKRYARVRK